VSRTPVSDGNKVDLVWIGKLYLIVNALASIASMLRGRTDLRVTAVLFVFSTLLSERGQSLRWLHTL